MDRTSRSMHQSCVHLSACLYRLLCWSRCRSNSAHTRQSRPDSGLGLQVKALVILYVVLHSLGNGKGEYLREDVAVHAPVVGALDREGEVLSFARERGKYLLLLEGRGNTFFCWREGGVLERDRRGEYLREDVAVHAPVVGALERVPVQLLHLFAKKRGRRSVSNHRRRQR